ncbi:MAG: hypothetical protein AB8B50_19700 [Pirellulaceae bacterium]
MPQDPNWLKEHTRDVYSQTGEDGVLEKALSVLPERSSWLVEFGAWDGKHLCNSGNLIENHDYRGVLIEGRPDRYQDLLDSTDRDSVVPINAWVNFDGDNRLDSLLREQAPDLPRDFDLLSIDIDGNDYHVWEAAVDYRPKMVIIEFNPTIPTEVSFVQDRDLDVCQGASLRALTELGKSKGYELICVLPWNAIFVRKELFSLYEIEDNSPETLRTDLSLITYLFSGFDGSVILQGHQEIPWQRMPIRKKQVQVLPKFLQKHTCSYNRLQRKILSVLRRVA